jgi:hypothetical protein
MALVLGSMLAAGAFGAAPAAAIGGAAPTDDIELPAISSFSAHDTSLHFNPKNRTFSAAIEGAPLKKVMAKVAAATGWKILIDPSADRTVSATFTNSAQGATLRRLLGGLNYAVVPQDSGPSKLFIFHNSMSEATETIEPAREKTARGKDWLKNEVLVSLAKNSTRDIDELAKKLGAKIVGRNDKLRTYRLQFDSEEAADKARDELASATDLRLDENYAVRNPENFGAPQGNVPPPFDLRADINPDGSHTVVAVVDTAVQALDAAKSQFLLSPINVLGETDPAKLASSAPLHGTSMVETLMNALADSNGQGEGTGVRILPINVYGNGETTSTYEVTLGVYAAVRNGARVVNLSLGGDGDSALLDDLIAQATQRGVVFFAAAGNTPTTAPTYPAANPLVYAVTASNSAGQIAPYANYGSFVDLIAPGTSYMNYGGTTYRVTGTSPATAYVSGVMASYLSTGMSAQQADVLIRNKYRLK